MRLPVYDEGRGAGRRCGPCSACCVALQVEEVPRAEFERCPHLRRGRGGCGIYADRPGPCREWRCLWLRGVGQARDRPDKLGVVLDVEWSEPLLAHVVKVFEVRPGAAKTPRVQNLVHALGEAGPEVVVVVARPGGRRAILGGTPAALERADAVLSRDPRVGPART